jgi:two-component system LytT family response regulator
MTDKIRVVIADDERPARAFLASVLKTFNDVEIVGEAANGVDAVKVIESKRPDLALLDLQMPEVDGLGVVGLLKKKCRPLVAFITAYDEYAVRAFELNAVDYILKPVEAGRLRKTLDRVRDRLDREDTRNEEYSRTKAASAMLESDGPLAPLERIPVRKRDGILLIPVSQIASVVADGELLHIRTLDNEKYTINYRLRDLEMRIDRSRFVRLGRGTIVSIEKILKIVPMPGGTFTVVLPNNQQFRVSRLQSRILREQMLKF